MIYKQDFVYITAYLLGIDKERFEKFFTFAEDNTWDNFNENKEMRIVHELCKLRVEILNNVSKLEEFMVSELTNMLYCKEVIEQGGVEYLKSNEIDIEVTNGSCEKYLTHINKLLTTYVSQLKNSNIFPDWFPFKQYSYMFIMRDKSTKRVIKKYIDSRLNYPYQLWVSYDMSRMEHNFLRNDKAMLQYIYTLKGEKPVNFDDKVCKFEDGDKYNPDSSNSESTEEKDTKLTKVSEIVSSKKNGAESVNNFVSGGKKALAVVDCENISVNVVVSVLKVLEQSKKVYKVILVDDENTTDDWSLLESICELEIKHITTKRLVDTKSIVDMQLALSTYEEKMKNKADRIILFASDSDYMCLIENVADEKTKFFVIYENENVRPQYISKLKEQNVESASIEEFEYIGVAEERQNRLLNDVLREINALYNINMSTIVENIAKEKGYTVDEENNILGVLVESLGICVGTGGEVSFVVNYDKNK